MGHLTIANLKSFLTIFSLSSLLILPLYCPSSLAQTSSKQTIPSLKLSESQQRQIADIKNRYRGPLEERRDTFNIIEEQLRRLMTSNVSTEEIRAKHSELRRISQEIEDLRFNSMLEIRQVLTTIQRSQLAQLMEKHRQKFSQMIRQQRGHNF
jgi:Spy/CpxP family protein refolding chaperone